MAKVRNAPPEKRTPLTALLDGGLVFLALAGSLFSFSTAFSLQVRTLPLMLGCGICALTALAVFSLPRLRWVPPIFIALGWALALYRLWDTLALGEISLRCSLVNTVVASLGSGQPIQPIAQLPEAVWQDACTALVLMAAVPLALLLGVSIMRARSFCLTALFCLPLVAAPLAITVTPAWPPLMAVLACWGTLLLPSLSVRGGQKGYDRLRLASLPVCALVLALLTAALPRSSYQRPAWADKANDELLNWASRISDEYFPSVHVFSGGMAVDQHVDLSSAGPLRYSGRTVLDVRSSDLRGRVYLRGFSSAVYDGQSWGPLEDEAYRLHVRGSSSVFYWNRQGDSSEVLQHAAGPAEASTAPHLMMELNGFQPLNFPALAQRETFPGHPYAKVTVRNIGATPGYVYVPYHILTKPEELSGAQFVQDAYLAAEEGVESHTLYIMPQCSPDSGAALPYASDASLAQRDYEEFVYRTYADYGSVPDHLFEVLLEWYWDILEHPEESLPGGAENEHYEYIFNSYGAADPYQMLQHCFGLITDALAFRCAYDPDTPATPEGEDFVEYFLTESRRGYCMHFASAATLLLRTFGIPARYVSGYVADIPASGRVLVPDANAHAWVEVYVSGYGWHPIEVTPAYAGGEPGISGGGLQAESTPTPTRTPAPSRNPIQNTPRPSAAPAPVEEETALDPRVLVAGAAALAALAALFLRRALARSLRKRRFAGADPNRAVIDMYRYLVRLSRRGGRIPDEAQALAEKAKFSQHTLTEDERSTMAALTQREAESLDARLSPVKRLLLRYWFGLY